MKRKLLFISLSFFILSSIGISHAEISQQYEGEVKRFQVSAYYSPQPNQEKYVSGSYEADLRMNGNGTHGADGTPVYVGMISAPSKYAFKTQIYLPGLGVGMVHDRGGGIYSAKGYDRLDIWMGKGDEGRVRALQWGRKMVSGIILTEEIHNTLAISTAEISRYSEESNHEVSRGTVHRIPTKTDKLEKGDHKGTPLQNTEKNHPSTPLGNRFSRNFSREDENEEVKKIQKFLMSQGVFSGNKNSVTNYYGPKTENSVFLFQKKYGIVKKWSDAGAGNWGPKTRAKANSIEVNHKGAPLQNTEKNHPSTPLGNRFSRNFSREDENEEVKKIQKFLMSQGVFSGNKNSVTNYYGPKTENSVFLFQKKYGIVKKWSDAGAGNWGPKTRAKANSVW